MSSQTLHPIPQLNTSMLTPRPRMALPFPTSCPDRITAAVLASESRWLNTCRTLGAERGSDRPRMPYRQNPPQVTSPGNEVTDWPNRHPSSNDHNSLSRICTDPSSPTLRLFQNHATTLATPHLLAIPPPPHLPTSSTPTSLSTPSTPQP
jgi:hypothetical protein